jgi:hypothetical protein
MEYDTLTDTQAIHLLYYHHQNSKDSAPLMAIGYRVGLAVGRQKLRFFDLVDAFIDDLIHADKTFRI